jgi:phage terminase large subunit-like protein
MWRSACPDWEDRIRQGQSLLPDLPWIESEAARALAIFGRLRLPDVPGRPLLRDAAGPWMRDTVRAVFGSFDPAVRQRALREFFVLVPKKNSKTTGGAAIMLTAMFMSRRPRAEFTLIAPTIEVAKLAFEQAVGMVEADPVLAAKCRIRDHVREIRYRPTQTFLKVKSFDPRTVTGGKPAGVLLDEIHVIAEDHNADRVIGQLRGGLISQPEAFLLMTTTQSERPPSGVFRAELMKARAVRDGKLIAPVLPLLYEFPKGIDWRDASAWWMVNPNNGFSVHVDRLVPDYEAADLAGIEELRRWASQHLNVEVGLALQSDYWSGALFWEKQSAFGGLSLEQLLERCDLVEIGIDGGGLDDMLGLAVLGREVETGDWLLWSRAWVHPIGLERRKGEAPRYRDLAEQGDLGIVEVMGADLEEVTAICQMVEASGKLDKIGVDPVGIASVLDALAAVGIVGERVVGIPQGWRLSGAIKTVERRLADGAFWHGGTSLMAWCVGNARVEPAGNAVKITKQASGVGKIDPVVAMFMAAALMSANPQPRLSVAEWIG